MRILLYLILSYAGWSIQYTKSEILAFLKFSKNAYELDNIEKHIFTYNNSNGLKIKIFEYKDYLIVAFKGTTLSIYGWSLGDGAGDNKIVDNALFNCCYTDECKSRNRQTIENYKYISDSVNLVQGLQNEYPDKKILLTGHSLGGSIASIVGRITECETVSFSSPGEKYFSDMISDNDESKVFHIGSCNDPIFMGECDGETSVCGIFGYYLNTKCHSGNVYCIGDMIGNSIVFHKIEILKEIISTNDVIKKIDTSSCKDCSMTAHNRSFITRILNDFILNRLRGIII